jgi:hypothetical protein
MRILLSAFVFAVGCGGGPTSENVSEHVKGDPPSCLECPHTHDFQRLAVEVGRPELQRVLVSRVSLADREAGAPITQAEVIAILNELQQQTH